MAVPPLSVDDTILVPQSLSDVHVTLGKPLPENPKASQRYCDQFNHAAEELKLKFRWTGDITNPLFVDGNELEFKSERVRKRYEKNLTKLQADVFKVLKKVEIARADLVQKSVDSFHPIDYKIDISVLTTAEQTVLLRLRDEVKPVLDAIEAQQHQPDVEAEVAYLKNNPDAKAQIAMDWLHHDMGFGKIYMANADNFSLVWYYPELPAINGMIAPEISFEEFTALAANANATDERLRPTTALSKNADGEIVATPLPLVPALTDEHQLLASRLDSIAATPNLDPLIAAQLSAWAQFFRTGSADDEAKAAQATIDAGESESLLRIHLGPSESYWPDNTKFPYLLQAGIVDNSLRTELKPFAESVQDMENSFNGIAGYQSRTIALRGGFASAMKQTVVGGFLQTFFLGEPGGNNFPNYAGYQVAFGVDGSSRFILQDPAYISQVTVTDDERKKLYNLFDAATLAKFPKFDDANRRNYIASLFVACHETGHLIGPQRGTITKKGVPLSVAFGEDWGKADEPKSDLLSLVQCDFLVKENKLSQNVLDEVSAALAMRMIGLYNRKGFGEKVGDPIRVPEHLFGATLILAWSLQTGAITWQTDASGVKHLSVNYKKIVESSRELLNKIIAYEYEGDREGYLKFAQECVLTNITPELDAAITAARSKKLDNVYKLNRIMVDADGQTL